MNSSAASNSDAADRDFRPRGPSSPRVALLALGCLLAAFLADVAYASRRLPDRVATHFDLQGEANGWMSRTQHLTLTCIFAVATPVFILGLFAFIRRRGGCGLNIPNKASWLAPERRQATFDFLDRQGVWLAALLVLFHAGVFHTVLSANRHTPPVLASGQIAWMTGAFLAAIGLWVIVLLVRFRRPTA